MGIHRQRALFELVFAEDFEHAEHGLSLEQEISQHAERFFEIPDSNQKNRDSVGFSTYCPDSLPAHFPPQHLLPAPAEFAPSGNTEMDHSEMAFLKVLHLPLVVTGRSCVTEDFSKSVLEEESPSQKHPSKSTQQKSQQLYPFCQLNHRDEAFQKFVAKCLFNYRYNVCQWGQSWLSATCYNLLSLKEKPAEKYYPAYEVCRQSQKSSSSGGRGAFSKCFGRALETVGFSSFRKSHRKEKALLGPSSNSSKGKRSLEGEEESRGQAVRQTEGCHQKLRKSSSESEISERGASSESDSLTLGANSCSTCPDSCDLLSVPGHPILANAQADAVNIQNSAVIQPSADCQKTHQNTSGEKAKRRNSSSSQLQKLQKLNPLTHISLPSADFILPTVNALFGRGNMFCLSAQMLRGFFRAYFSLVSARMEKRKRAQLLPISEEDIQILDNSEEDLLGGFNNGSELHLESGSESDPERDGCHCLCQEEFASLAEITRVMDVGAGVGTVTREICKMFKRESQEFHLVATEVNGPLCWRLQRSLGPTIEVFQCEDPLEYFSRSSDSKNLTVKQRGGVKTAEEPAPFDLITCLNVLDRTLHPIALLQSMQKLLRGCPEKGEKGGKRSRGLKKKLLLLACVLPWAPLNPEIFPKAQNSYGSRQVDWLQAVSYIAQDLSQIHGFQVELISRVPYISEGGLQQPLYVLDDAVFLLSTSC